MTNLKPSTAQNKPLKPEKPDEDFPLFPHQNGSWAKKVRGKLHYFGPWSDPEGARKKWLEQKDDLLAGRLPRSTQQDGFTVADLCNRFLNSKRHQLDTQELSPRTFAEYYSTCEMITKSFGATRLVDDLRPEDFERFKMGMPRSWGPGRRGKIIVMVRSLFRYAADEDLVDRPVKFGKQFKGPSKKVLRLHRAKQGKRMFEAAEIRRMLKRAGPNLKTMVLLAVNCGFGNSDVSSLHVNALDLKAGWVDFPRPKTGIARRAKLWPETVTALRKVIADRPIPKDEADVDLVFLTKPGGRWVKVRTEEQKGGTLKVKCDDAVSKETKKLLALLDINGHRNFYTLRHTFRTVADESKDQPAIDHIMGHSRDDMASVYRESISNERLAAVGDHVRRWLFPNAK